MAAWRAALRSGWKFGDIQTIRGGGLGVLSREREGAVAAAVSTPRRCFLGCCSLAVLGCAARSLSLKDTDAHVCFFIHVYFYNAEACRDRSR